MSETLPVIWKEWTSTNGRWGLDILVPNEEIRNSLEANKTVLPEGRIEDLGRISNRKVLRFTPELGVNTWLTFEDEAINGGIRVAHESLQSNQEVTVLLLGPIAITQSWGYKGRSTCITLWKKGVAEKLSEAQLLGLGLIEPSEAGTDVHSPPEIEGPMAEQLRKLGLD